VQTYRIPHTDLKASRLAYGCMNIGGRWDAASMTKDERKAAIEAVAAAFDHGINFFDHADIYMHGRSEEVFAEAIAALKVPRKDMIIQSKCGIRFGDDPSPGDPGRYDFSYEHITRSVEGILSRLRIDTLDILLLHRPDALMEPQEVARAFDALQRSGKVRHFGVSNFTGPQIAYLQAALDQPLVVNQVELSLLHHHLINDGVMANTGSVPAAGAAGTLDYCQRRDVLIQAWSPVAGGALFTPPADASDAVRRCAALVAQLAREKDTSLEAIVLGWLLRHPAPIQPVIGTTRPARIAASALADAIELSREEWYRLFIAARGAPLP
jgi:predicted oxidoreductase